MKKRGLLTFIFAILILSFTLVSAHYYCVDGNYQLNGFPPRVARVYIDYSVGYLQSLNKYNLSIILSACRRTNLGNFAASDWGFGNFNYQCYCPTENGAACGMAEGGCVSPRGNCVPYPGVAHTEKILSSSLNAVLKDDSRCVGCSSSYPCDGKAFVVTRDFILTKSELESKQGFAGEISTTTGDGWFFYPDYVLFPVDIAWICGDGICDPDETCSSCSTDCGACPSQSSHQCSDSNQTIFKLYQASNSHGALWNDAGYTKYEYTTTNEYYPESGSGIADCTVNTNPGVGFVLEKRECLLSRASVGTCYSDICLWKKEASIKYEYTTTHKSVSEACSVNAPPGYALKKEILISPSTPYSKICFWERQVSANYNYIITHRGKPPTGPAVDCSVDANPGDNWILKKRECIYNNPVGCTSDLCLWEKGIGYNYDICYDEIFGVNYTGANPHPSSCSVSVLWLYSETNSHASTTNANGYNIPVCYGNLICTARQNTCNADEKMAVALFSDSSSHLTDPNYMPSGMVSWWRFDDGTAKDWLEKNNGVLKNGASSVNSKIGKGMDFDGIDDYVEVPYSSSLDMSGDITISMWVKPESTQVPFASLIDVHNCDARAGWTVQQDGSLTNKFYSGISIGGVAYCNESTNHYTTLTANQWQYFVVQRKGNKIYHYLNGKQTVDCNIPTAPLDPSLYPLKIGYSCYGRFFNGSIDEVAIYNRALTSEEIQHRYNLGVYEKKICCKPEVVGEIYWANMLNANINTSEIEDTVKLIWKNTGLADGTQVSFAIYEDDFADDESIRTVNTIVKNGNAIGIWRITQADYELGNPTSDLGIELLDNQEEFFFKVSDRNSGNLIVNNTPGTNSPPRARIIKPVLDEKIKVNKMINFEAAVEDEDDDLSVLWNFGDGTTKNFAGCLSGTNCNTNHNYTKWGTKIITITATEIGRATPQTAENYTRIFIYDSGINVFAVINEPPFGKIFEQGVKLIEFNAVDSYVANCTIGNAPAGWTEPYSVEDLNCTDIHKRATPLGELNGYELHFNWTFSEGAGRSGTWTNDYYGMDVDVVMFDRAFFAPTRHWADLKLGFESFF